MKQLLLTLLLCSFTFAVPAYAGGKCNGSDPCSACTNCSRCKYCKTGYCGACKPTPPPKPKKAKKVVTDSVTTKKPNR